MESDSDERINRTRVLRPQELSFRVLTSRLAGSILAAVIVALILLKNIKHHNESTVRQVRQPNMLVGHGNDPIDSIAYRCLGVAQCSRYERWTSPLASSSPTICSDCGSNVSDRPKRVAMLPRWQSVVER